jgi:hypothetical protein
MGMSSNAQRRVIAVLSEEGNRAVTSISAEPTRSVKMSAFAKRTFPPCCGGTMGIPQEVTNGASAKLTSAPVSIRVEYTQPLNFTMRKTASCVGSTTAALRFRSTELLGTEIEPQDTVEDGVEAGGPAVIVAALPRIEAGEEAAEEAAVDDVDDADCEEDADDVGGFGFCTPEADRVTLSERRGQDGSLA